MDAGRPDVRAVRTLAATSLVATLFLVTLGGYTRGSDSGYGCADRWPLCEGGALGGFVPRAEFHMIVEWTHRWVAAAIGILVIATAVMAWQRHARRSVRWSALGAVMIVGIQSIVGRQVVKGDLDADLVSLHLFTAMMLLALLCIAAAYSTGSARPPTPSDRRWAIAFAGAAITTLVVLMLGSNVHNVLVSGWPLVGGELVPSLDSRIIAVHYFHRLLAGAATLLVVWLAVRSRSSRRPERLLVVIAAVGYVGNVALGAAHVATEVRSSAIVALHLGFASVAWTGLVLAWLMARSPPNAVDSLPAAFDAPAEPVAVT